MGKTEKIKTLLTSLTNRVTISKKYVVSGIVLSGGVLAFHYAKKNKFSFRKFIKYTRSRLNTSDSDSESEQSHDSENIQFVLSETNTKESTNNNKSFLGRLFFS